MEQTMKTVMRPPRHHECDCTIVADTFKVGTRCAGGRCSCRNFNGVQVDPSAGFDTTASQVLEMVAGIPTAPGIDFKAPWSWEMNPVGRHPTRMINPIGFILTDAADHDLAWGAVEVPQGELPTGIKVCHQIIAELIRLSPDMEATIRKNEWAGTEIVNGGPAPACPECHATSDMPVHRSPCSIGTIIAQLDAARAAKAGA